MNEPLWGIGQWEDADGTRRPWEISSEEMGRDMAAAGRSLTALGVGKGDLVLWCSMLSEAGQFWPFVVATMLAGARLSCADATSAEAPRVAMFCRLIRYRAVMGITGALLDGLDEIGLDYPTVFGGVGILGARPDAYGRLASEGLTPHHFIVAGPAVAVGCQPGTPAAADDAEWELSSAGGHIAVSARRTRATIFDRTPTALRGKLTGNGVIPDPIADRS